jgi:hypothetical protein
MYSRIKLKQITLCFSGAFDSPMRRDGTPMPSSVLYLDTEECVRDEMDKIKRCAELYGLATPKVKDVQYLASASVNEPNAVWQIDLCGGVFGLPKFATAAPVQTFATMLETQLASTTQTNCFDAFD